MAWTRKQLYTRLKVTIYDRILGETVCVERIVEEAEGYHHFGRLSYRGERMRVVGGYPDFPTEDYPPTRSRCRTRTALDWYSAQSDSDPPTNR